MFLDGEHTPVLGVGQWDRHCRYLAFITQSDLDWTILRPAMLSDGVLTGRYAVTPASTAIPASSAGISREDVAHMMLDTMERGAYVKEIVWLRGVRA